MQSLRVQHAHIVDALTGSPFNTLDQCVAIDVAGDAELVDIGDVRGLSSWLRGLLTTRRSGAAADVPSTALLTAPPAAGKTTLISQAVMLALDEPDCVPIVVKV